MNHALLLLGGGTLATPALRWAREAGLRVILTDSDPHAPLRRAAHEFHLIPSDSGEALAALARRLSKEGRLAGILATDPASLAPLASVSEVAKLLPPRATLERLRDPAATRVFLGDQDLAVGEPTGEDQPLLDVFAFFRDGAFVPAGIAERRTPSNGDVVSLQPGELTPEGARSAYVLVERAARALGFEQGPLQATLLERAGEPTLVALHPGFADFLGATRVAQLVYGKSPLQAWFAHLAGSGGPFDEVLLEPRTGAGWLAIAPQRAGLFAGIDGTAQARALPGFVDLWIDEPGRQLVSPELPQRPLGYLWVEGHDRAELEERLIAARARLEPRVAVRQRVA